MLEILLNERNFSPKNFFKQDSPSLEAGQTLRIAQGVAYLKFRYYYEILDEENSEKVLRMIDALEELDDVQNVFTNALYAEGASA